MFVDSTAVPGNSAMKFTPPDVGAATGIPDPVDPPECAPVFWGPAHTQMGGVSWSTMTPTGPAQSLSDGKVFNVFLAVPTEHPDLDGLLQHCGTIRFQGQTMTASALSLPGLPPGTTAWSVATSSADGAQIIGLCRGLYVSATFNQLPSQDISPNDKSLLATLFHDQVTKLEAI